MTTLTTTMARAQAISAALAELGLPAPTSINPTTPGGSQAVMGWTPDLSPADAATLATVVKLAIGGTLISPAERATLDPQFTELRSFRTRSLAAWNALTAAQRQADQIAYLNDLTDVIRAMLRD